MHVLHQVQPEAQHSVGCAEFGITHTNYAGKCSLNYLAVIDSIYSSDGFSAYILV